MFNCGIFFIYLFFFLQTINCVTVYSWALLRTQGCLIPYLKTYHSIFIRVFSQVLSYFIDGARSKRMNFYSELQKKKKATRITALERQKKSFHMVLHNVSGQILEKQRGCHVVVSLQIIIKKKRKLYRGSFS